MDRANPASPIGLGLRLVSDYVTGTLSAGLGACGVRAIVLKGPSLRALLYDEEEARVSQDIDLLLSEQSLAAAEEALPRLGCRFVGVTTAERDRPNRRAWIHESTGIPLELHLTLTGSGAKPQEVWRVLTETTKQLHVGAQDVEVLDDAALVMHIVLNVAHHGRANAKTMIDLERALSRIPRSLWEEAAPLAARLDATSAFAAGLRLLPRGAALVRELDVDVPPTISVALRAETAPPLAQGLEWLRRLPSNRARLRFAREAVFPPPDFLRVWSPKARRGRLGLASAYLGRPVWIISRLPQALLAWRRARRAAAR